MLPLEAFNTLQWQIKTLLNQHKIVKSDLNMRAKEEETVLGLLKKMQEISEKVALFDEKNDKISK